MNIRLAAHADCVNASECGPFAKGLHDTLATGRYAWPASIVPLDDIDAHLAAHRTARKRAARCSRLGYSFAEIDRADHEDDVYRINTSMPERQGRPMSESYMRRQQFSTLPAYACPRHCVRTYGVLAPGGALVAYLVLHVSGELALVSQILGHAAHLSADVMYLLTVETFRDTLERTGPVVCFYNRHDSGQPGLRYFKERLGFRPERVKWLL